MESKKLALPEIEKIVSSGRESANQHNSLIKAMNRFAQSFVEMSVNECPEFTEKTKQIAALINGAMDQEKIISEAELRLIEDINDLSARYDALNKYGNEINAKRSQLESIKKKIIDIERAIDADKLTGGKKQYKLGADLQSSQRKKEETTQQLIEMLEQFIKMRERYAKFKVNRLEHGYKNLGNVVETALEVEKHLIGQLQRDCEQARDNLEDFFGTVDDSNEQIEPAPETNEEHADEEHAGEEHAEEE